MSLTIIADENIAQIDEYLDGHDVHLIKMAGRQIPTALDDYKPDALFIRSVTPINATTLSHHPSFIATATLGIDHVDTSFLAQHSISFANAIGSSKHSVAQYVITAILTLRPHSLHTPIRLGIIGLGNIGKTLAKYAKALGWQVAGFDPFLPKDDINNSLLDDVLTSDVVSIHTPLTTDSPYPTFGLINKHTLAIMPKDTLLINSARGQVIDQSALLDDIAHTHRQVVLDVFPDEPMIAGQLLDKLALATPHIAGYTLDGKLRGTDMVYQAFCRHFDLPVLHQLSQFLPPNPFLFKTLIDTLTQGNNCLSEYYDIIQDDRSLRAIANPDVQGGLFDGLRKNYHLKREWVF